jgi:uncharacterized protein DUF3306
VTSDKDEKGFLTRWSERKVAVEEAEKTETLDDLELLKADPDALPVEGDDASLSPDGEPEFVPTEEDVEKLDINSDYSKFLKNSVPQHIKRMALQKLWRTDPAFGVVDGLLEYGEDYSDMSNKGAAIQSAYQAGKGYLNRGKKAVEDVLPEKVAVAGENTPPPEAAGKDQSEDTTIEVAAEAHEAEISDGDNGNGEDDVA